jgi:predicted PurR-regulated permease PerM
LKVFIGILLVIAVVIALFIVWSFLIPILTAAILAYLFYPFYRIVNKTTRMKNLSAAVVTIIIILLIVIPAGFLLYEVGRETSAGYVRAKQIIYGGFEECEAGAVCDFLRRPQTRYYIEQGLTKITTYLTEGAYNFILSLPRRLLDLLLMVFTIFFLLRDGEHLVEKAREYNPLRRKHEEHIFRQLKEVTRSIIYGFFLMAIIEGIIAVITFRIAGITAPILWAIVIAILAFIPFIGSTVIWVPAAIILFLLGDTRAMAIIIIGGIIISSIDTFIKPRVVGKRAKVHPILIFIGLLGGLQIFGLVGIILGPLMLALVFTFIDMYRKERAAA